MAFKYTDKPWIASRRQMYCVEQSILEIDDDEDDTSQEEKIREKRAQLISRRRR